MDEVPKLPPRPDKNIRLSAVSNTTSNNNNNNSMRVSKNLVFSSDRDLLYAVPPPPPPHIVTPAATHLITSPFSSSSNSTTASLSHLKLNCNNGNSGGSGAADLYENSHFASVPQLAPLTPTRVPANLLQNFQPNQLYSLSTHENIIPPNNTATATLPIEQYFSPFVSSMNCVMNTGLENRAFAPELPPPRPNTLKPLTQQGVTTTNGDSNHLISLNSNSNNDEDTNKEKLIQMIKSMIITTSSSSSPVCTPTVLSPTIQMMPPMAYSMHGNPTIQYIANPLYSNNFSIGSMVPINVTPSSMPVAYSNRLDLNGTNGNYMNLPSSMVTIASTPLTVASNGVMTTDATAAAAFHHHHYYMPQVAASVAAAQNQQDQINEIINKIHNQSARTSVSSDTLCPESTIHTTTNTTTAHHSTVEVLTPTTVYANNTTTDALQILNMFDPLTQSHISGSTPSTDKDRASPIPPPPLPSSSSSSARSSPPSLPPRPTTPNPKTANDKRRSVVRSNSTENKLTNSINTSTSTSTDTSRRASSYCTRDNDCVNLLQVDDRKLVHSRDLQEYFDHLRALYLSLCSKTKLSNTGLVFSPRIEIQTDSKIWNITNGTVGTHDLYLVSPATRKLQSSGLNNSHSSDNSAESNDANMVIFDIRFNVLVYSKLTGVQVPTFESLRSQEVGAVWYSKKLTCAIDSTVEMIISHVVCNIETLTAKTSSSSSQVKIEDFLLKLYSRNEYIAPRTTLSSYVYVQQCKKMSQDIVLELVDQTLPEFWRPFLRSESDNAYIASEDQFTTTQLLPPESLLPFRPINSSQVNRLLEELNIAFAQFLSMTDVACIMKERSLFNDIRSRINELTICLSRCKTKRLRCATEDLCHYYEHHIINNGIGSNDVMSLNEMLERFRTLFDEILQAFAEVIKIYSNRFPVNFQLMTSTSNVGKTGNGRVPIRKEDISKHIETLKLRIDVVTQVPVEMKSQYTFFALRITLSYGFKVLAYKYTDRQMLDAECRLEFDRDMCFETMSISDLPRESRLNFHLIGFRKENSGQSKLDVDILAGTFFYLFDRDNLFQHGVQLVPFTLFKPFSSFTINSYDLLDHYRPVLCDENFLCHHELDPNSMMIVFALPTSLCHVKYCYPELNIASPTLLRSLSKNLYDTTGTTTATADQPTVISLDMVPPISVSRQESNISQTSASSVSLCYNDSLYGFYGRSIEALDRHNRLTIIKIVQRNPLEELNREERSLIWENRDQLSRYPGAILKILKSPPRWSHNDAVKVYELLDTFWNYNDQEAVDANQQQQQVKLPFVSAIEALQLLGADYPDQQVRLKAVRWLKTVATDELCDYLPQLVQSLRYEAHIDCSLIWLLFECSFTSARFCHHFYWTLKSCTTDPVFGKRCQIYLQSLLALSGRKVKQMFEKQEYLCAKLASICAEIKSAREQTRQPLLKQLLQDVHEYLETSPISIPLSPSVQVFGLEISQCSYFASNSIPLKIVFQGSPPYCTVASMADTLAHTRPNLIGAIYEQKKQLNKVMFKCGDDLRQDMLVMQLVSIINRIWIRAGLDLRLITFGVMHNADRTGMIELVSRARTLRQIQVEHGVTGNFKHHTIASWLKRHNLSEFDYMMTVENFIHSCAGYVVITYLLGICDRHNDNIMVTTTGHLFHIDFGKFLGDAQMMAGFRRDRAPFVFTADMAYVINEGDKPSKNYQFFVELCCNCLSLVRQHGDFLLSLLAMMIPSGIFGLKPETIKYFHNALLPDLTDSQAKAQFNRLIEKALGSFATQVNFFIHNIAQLRFNSSSSSASSSSSGQASQSNINQLYSDPTVALQMLSSSTIDYSNGGANGSGGGGNGDGLTEHNGNNNNAITGDETDLPSLEDVANCAWRFSFSECRFTHTETEGTITRLEVVNLWKRIDPNTSEKIYYYKVKVDRRNQAESFVYRSYREFLELNEKLARTFILANFVRLSKSPLLARSNRRDIARMRIEEIQSFLTSLLRLASEISHSDIVYTFFHQFHRDFQFIDIEADNNRLLGSMSNVNNFGVNHHRLSNQSIITNGIQSRGKIKLALNYRDDALHVLVCYARNLETERCQAPDTYVKLYLKPDSNKSTKRKTRVVSKNPNPTYMEEIIYRYRLEDLQTKFLEVSVWANDISGNSRLGLHVIQMKDFTRKPSQTIEEWYPLNNGGGGGGGGNINGGR